MSRHWWVVILLCIAGCGLFADSECHDEAKPVATFGTECSRPEMIGEVKTAFDYPATLLCRCPREPK